MLDLPLFEPHCVHWVKSHLKTGWLTTNMILWDSWLLGPAGLEWDSLPSLRSHLGWLGQLGASLHLISRSPLVLWTSSYGGGGAPWKKQERASPNKQVFLQASACITFAYVPLIKASHMAKPKVNVGGGYLKAWITGAHYYKNRPQLSP